VLQFGKIVAMRQILAIYLAVLLATGALVPRSSAQPTPKMRKKKKNEDKEPVTQVLAIPPDPPGAISAETGKLTFQVSPLSAKGLLSQQSRDALKAILAANKGASIVRLRALVAGTGDMRRVQAIVSETFTEKKLPLPVLTTVQVGALPMAGAQVVLEAISMDRKTTNPDGLAFLSGFRAPDVQGALNQLKVTAEEAGANAAAMLQVTCFLSSLDEEAGARAQVSSAFPSAAVNLVEAQRIPTERAVVCEGVARASSSSKPGSRAAIVRTPKVLFSGIQMSFGKQDADLQLAFDRLKKALTGVPGAGTAVSLHFYSADHTIAAKLPGLARQAFPEGQLSVTTLDIEGLPSLDATVAMDMIAEAN
jgi:enamine deaminase RidA (YjgF/YER057c/UK114 family)